MAEFSTMLQPLQAITSPFACSRVIVPVTVETRSRTKPDASIAIILDGWRPAIILPEQAMGKRNPVVYLDTSIVIDYALAEGREPEANRRPMPFFGSELEKKQQIYWEELFQSDKRYQLAVKLRSILGWNHPKERVVISPFVLLELDEWFAAETFKRNALEGIHVKAISRYSPKDIGKYIRQVFRDAKRSRAKYSYPKLLWGSIASSARGERLAGIKIEAVDKLRFDSNAFAKVSLLSHMQMGMADIVHLLAADALKCTHFASIDDDFNRLRSEIERKFKFKVLFRDEILSIVKSAGPAPFTGRELKALGIPVSAKN